MYRTTQKFGIVRAVPLLCGFYRAICLTAKERAQKTSVRVAVECHDGTMKKHAFYCALSKTLDGLWTVLSNID